MKGTLMKTDQGWMVNCNYSINKNDWETLPLHPEFIEMMDTCFTSKFTNEIEFEIVTEWENGEVGVNGLAYAKLINNVPDVVEDDVEKLALEWNNGEMPMHYHKREGFKSGYNKAKETLYTEEQMRMAFEYGKGVGGLELKDDFEQYIQSIKQPKQ
jgi:hypothetical protein